MAERDPSRDKVSLWEVAKSVLASFFGVQSQAKRERDFTQGSPAQFIIVGLIATAIFVLLVWLVVKLILGLATAG